MTRVIVTADDFGLSRGITDGIVECVERGIVARVSMLANGLAFDYAADTYRALAQKPELALHLNLTEGKALTDPARISHLVLPDGTFRYSPLLLLIRTWLPVGRRALRDEIARELRAQYNKIASIADDAPLFLDGHQHVQMVPMVFREVCALHLDHPLAGVRISREQLLAVPFKNLLSIGGWIRHLSLYALALLNGHMARMVGLRTPGVFIGAFESGALTLPSIACALSAAEKAGAQSVEIGAHPGIPQKGELDDWRGDTKWHYRPSRLRERDLFRNEALVHLVTAYPHVAYHGASVAKIARFGISGVTAATTQMYLLYALTEYGGVWYLYSAVLSWCVALVISFVLQKYWTFGERARGFFSHQMTQYVALQGTNVVVNTAFMYVTVDFLHVPYLVAQIIIILILAVTSFFIGQRFIFTHRV